MKKLIEHYHQNIGKELYHFGGILKCNKCGKERSLGSIENKLANGWPKCCGYTMRWITARQMQGFPAKEISNG